MDDLDEFAIDILAYSAQNAGDVRGKTRRQSVDFRSSINVTGSRLDPDFHDRVVTALYDPPDVVKRLDERLREFRHNNPGLVAQESRTRAVVRALGIPLPDGRGNLPLSASWARLDAALTPEQHASLLPLIHWANNAGIAPPDVVSDVMQRFADDHRVGRDPKSSLQTVRRIARDWARVAATLGTVPVANPTPYAERGFYCFPDEAFAAPLLAQLDEAVRVWTTVLRGRTLQPHVAGQRRYLVLLTISAYCRATGSNPAHIKSVEEFLDA